MAFARVPRSNVHHNRQHRTMDDEITTTELPATRREVGILLVATISIAGFALIVLVWQVLGWGEVSGWGWLGAIVQAALLLAIALVAPLLARDLLAKLHDMPTSSGDGGEEAVSNPSL